MFQIPPQILCEDVTDPSQEKKKKDVWLSALFHMASMLDNYFVITFDVCTVHHLPRQLSSLRHLRDMTARSDLHLGSPLTTQSHELII